MSPIGYQGVQTRWAHEHLASPARRRPVTNRHSKPGTSRAGQVGNLLCRPALVAAAGETRGALPISAGERAAVMKTAAAGVMRKPETATRGRNRRPATGACYRCSSAGTNKRLQAPPSSGKTGQKARKYGEKSGFVIAPSVSGRSVACARSRRTAQSERENVVSRI